MYRYPKLAWVVLVSLIGCGLKDAPAQTARQLRRDRLQLESTLGVQDAKIGEQRVARQVEIARLERQIEGFESRMTRLERQMLSMSRLPGITIPEAEAEVNFAKAQLEESEQLHNQGEGSEVQLAHARLALVRAEGQLQVAKTANAEIQLILELEVAYAKRQLLVVSNEKQQLERLVAKGYTSSDGLRYQIIDVGLAEKQLQLAQLRLDALRKSSGEPVSPTKSE